MDALALLYSRRMEDSEYVFASNRRDGRAISRIQAWRIIHKAVEALHITGTIAPHSLRKTFGYHAAVEESMSPVLLMEIYNHSSFEVTKRYLGLRQEELDGAYLSVILF